MADRDDDDADDEDTDDTPTISVNDLKKWLVQFSFEVSHEWGDRVAAYIDAKREAEHKD